jgi:hypothetical protein
VKRTTISLPDELGRALEREARRRSTSISDLSRRAIGAYLGVDGEEPRRLPFVAVGRSGEGHVARDAEEILDREWGAARGR